MQGRGLGSAVMEPVLRRCDEQGLGVPPVGEIGPHPGVDREHHGVEVVATEGLDERGRCGEAMAGDADEASQPLVASAHDRIGGMTALIEHVDTGDAM